MKDKKLKLGPTILVNKGRQCGILGNEERFYNNKKAKKNTLADVINK